VRSGSVGIFDGHLLSLCDHRQRANKSSGFHSRSLPLSTSSTGEFQYSALYRIYFMKLPRFRTRRFSAGSGAELPARMTAAIVHRLVETGFACNGEFGLESRLRLRSLLEFVSHGLNHQRPTEQSCRHPWTARGSANQHRPNEEGGRARRVKSKRLRIGTDQNQQY
jgi:hypothetical protein